MRGTRHFDRRAAVAEAAAAGFILVAGTLLHFAYSWCGRATLVAPFAAVNESVWEHLKLAFWPAVAAGAVQRAVCRPAFPNLLWAKAVGVLTMLAGIILGAGGIDLVWGEHFLAIDVALFAAAIVVGQAVSWSQLRLAEPRPWLNRLGLAVLASLAVAFIGFTFAPPEWALFRDPVTGGYGIPG